MLFISYHTYVNIEGGWRKISWYKRVKTVRANKMKKKHGQGHDSDSSPNLRLRGLGFGSVPASVGSAGQLGLTTQDS